MNPVYEVGSTFSYKDFIGMIVEITEDNEYIVRWDDGEISIEDSINPKWKIHSYIPIMGARDE